MGDGGPRRKAGDGEAVRRPGWGGVTRRGARQVTTSAEEYRARDRRDVPDRGRPDEWTPDVWQRDDGPPPADTRAKEGPSPTRSPSRRRAPAPVAAEIAKSVGDRRSAKVERLLVDAARAFERDRPQDAYRILRPLAEEAPDASAVRELAGLAAYRLGRWSQAVAHLEAFFRLTGSVEQHPVLADCYRALRRPAKVAALWDELRQRSPGSELVTEGRIVMAGSLADQGELRKAIGLLEKAPVSTRRPPPSHQLRLWYALADLYERVGDTPRARDLFKRVAAVDPDLADTAERLHALA
ncbi:MAG: tetratricopeptide repeat protein [Acidimicrobiales bacterium]